jgi:hypothetical protein
MVRVVIWRNSHGEISGFETKGHANYGAEGNDILCAGISALTQSAVLGLYRYLNIKLEVQHRKGQLLCRLPEDLNPDLRKQADAILETMLIGLLEIRQIAPGKMTVVDEGGVPHV